MGTRMRKAPDREPLSRIFRSKISKEILDDETATHMVYSVSFTFDKTFDETMKYLLYKEPKGHKSG